MPGVVGAICLLIALYAFQMLPVNYAGAGCCWSSVLAMMIAEAFMPSFGSLGVGGIVAFVVGGLFLIDTEVPGFGVPLALIIGLALASAAFTAGYWQALRHAGAQAAGGQRARGDDRARPATVIGRPSKAAGGRMVHGERWRARSPAALEPGDRVRVDRLDGLTLDVSPAAESSTFRSASS